jgi:hypothetical protein
LERELIKYLLNKNQISKVMARLELSGKIEFIGDVVKVGEKGTDKQVLMLVVPPRKDEWSGAEYGEPEFWELSAIGDSVEKLKMTDAMVGKEAIVRVYLNSKAVKKESGEGYFYPINANIAAIIIKS